MLPTALALWHTILCCGSLHTFSRSASVVARIESGPRIFHLLYSGTLLAMKRSAMVLVLLCALLMPQAVRAQQTQPAPTNPQTVGAKPAAPQDPSATQGNPDVQVWVNMKSGIYHCPGTHWYGTTKLGVYMKQSEAQQKGFRPAYHRACK